MCMLVMIGRDDGDDVDESNRSLSPVVLCQTGVECVIYLIIIECLGVIKRCTFALL